MQFRRIALIGLALAPLAGCQSYFPNTYGGAGPYSAFPQGGYGPPPGVVGPPTTFQPGRTPPPGQITTETPPLKNNVNPPKGQGSVPNPREPGSGPPTSLGTPDNEEEETIRRSTSRREKPPARIDGLTDESEEQLEAFGTESFTPPRVIESASAIDEGDEMPRVTKRLRPIPYKYDAKGYTWLRGTVSRDPSGEGWRLRYSQNPLDDDKFGGSFLLVVDEKIDELLEDDVVLVKGRIDRSVLDENGKPSYRVNSLEFLEPKQK